MIKNPAPSHSRIRLAVLGSGSGTNLQAILEAIKNCSIKAEIALVLSDQPDAYILSRATRANLPTSLIDCHGFSQKFPLQSQAVTAERLLHAEIDIVCLAGFMRLIGTPLLEVFPNRILNIHPSLLPAFPGLHAWEQALNHAATESGCTVHYVDSGMDTGSIIAQAKVPILPDDSPSTLHARIQEEEHRLYPIAIAKVIRTISGNESPSQN